MTERKRVCMICGKPFEFTICETCKAHVQGEALERKLRIENTVRAGHEIEVERRMKGEQANRV
ncbi:MAG TPA: hypothetical protein VLB01_03115 [Thermodesulfobacteriota bacterium]|nr:hypothetical protein [Thermodesulfobacteriota bacterium]